MGTLISLESIGETFARSDNSITVDGSYPGGSSQAAQLRESDAYSRLLLSSWYNLEPLAT